MVARRPISETEARTGIPAFEEPPLAAAGAGRRLAIERRIVEQLRARQLTSWQIAARVGVDEGDAEDCLADLERRGDVVRSGDAWTIPGG